MSPRLPTLPGQAASKPISLAPLMAPNVTKQVKFIKGLGLAIAKLTPEQLIKAAPPPKKKWWQFKGAVPQAIRDVESVTKTKKMQILNAQRAIDGKKPFEKTPVIELFKESTTGKTLLKFFRK